MGYYVEQKSTEKDVSEELEWIKMRKELTAPQIYEPETIYQNRKSHFMRFPLIPLGALATIAALGYGLATIKNLKKTHFAMKVRIASHAFTLGAFVYAYYIVRKEAVEREQYRIINS